MGFLSGRKALAIGGLTALIVTIASVTAVVVGQAQSARRAQSFVVTLDFTEFSESNPRTKEFYDDYGYEVAYNIGRFDDGDVTCFILGSPSGSFEPIGISCVR